MSTQHIPTPDHLSSRFASEASIASADPWLSATPDSTQWPTGLPSSGPAEAWSSSWNQSPSSNMAFMRTKDLSTAKVAPLAAQPAVNDRDSFFFHIRPGQRLQSWDQFVVGPQISKKANLPEYSATPADSAVLHTVEAGGELLVSAYAEKPWTVVPSGAPVPDLVSPITPTTSLPASPSKLPTSASQPSSPSQKGDGAAAAAAAALAAAAARRNSEIEQELQQQSLYKTELCRSWAETGACRYGTKCQFAHGVEELRPVMRHPKYKTEICRTFHTLGTCPYGTRCRFIHNRDGVLPPEWSSEIQRARSMSQPAMASPTHTQQMPASQPVTPVAADAAPLGSVDSSPVAAAADVLSQRFTQMNLAPMSWEVPAPAARASMPAAVPVPSALEGPLEEEKDKKGKRKPRLPFFERLTVKKKDKESKSNK